MRMNIMLFGLLGSGLALLPVQSAFAADSASAEFGAGNSTKVVRLGFQWGWDKQWLQSNGTHVGGYWEGTLAQWRGKNIQGVSETYQNITNLGITPVFRFQSDDRKGLYGEAGIGFHLLSDLYNSNGRRFSTSAQFGNHLGIGYVLKNGMDIGLKIQHFSNGSIRRPNPGVNYVVLKLGYAF